jgi:hypothetical protein
MKMHSDTLPQWEIISLLSISFLYYKGPIVTLYPNVPLAKLEPSLTATFTTSQDKNQTPVRPNTLEK